MKILLLAAELDGHSGYATYAKDTIVALQQQGHTVVVAAKKDQDCAYPLWPDHLQFVSRPWNKYWYGWRLRQIVYKEQPDIIHCTVELYSHCLLLLPIEYQKKCVIVLHGTYAVQQFLFTQTKRSALRLLTNTWHYIAVSNFTKQRVEATIQQVANSDVAATFAQKTTVIHNAISVPVVQPFPPAKERLLVHVGGIKHRKGVRELLAGFNEYYTTHSKNIRLVIIGRMYEQSSYYAEMVDYIAAHNLQTVVTITGPIADEALQSYYAKACAFALPAITEPDYFEGFGLVFLEANAYGTACIGPNDSGATEAIKPNVTGYQVDPSDPKQIATALHTIVDTNTINPADCRTWAEQHSVEVFGTQIAKLYSQLFY